MRKTGNRDHVYTDKQAGKYTGATTCFKDHMSFVPVPGFPEPRGEKTGNEKDKSR